MTEIAIHLFFVLFIAALLVTLVRSAARSMGWRLGAQGRATVTVMSLVTAGLFVLYLVGNSA